MPTSYDFKEPVPYSGYDKLPPNYLMDPMLQHQQFQQQTISGAMENRRIAELETKLDAIAQLLYHNRHLFEGLVPDLAKPTEPPKKMKTEVEIRKEMHELQEKAKADGVFEPKNV